MKYLLIFRSGGISIRGLAASAISRRKPLGEPVLETYKFIPNVTDNLSLSQSIRILVQLAFENIQNIKIRTVEMLEESLQNTNLLSTHVQEVLEDLPLIQADINVFTNQRIEEIPGINILEKKLVTESKSCLLVIVSNVLERPQVLVSALSALVFGGFVLARERKDFDISKADLSSVDIILQHNLQDEKIILVKKRKDIKYTTAIDVSSGVNNLDWLAALQSAVKTDPLTVVYSEGEELSGVLGLVNCIRKEPGCDNVRCVFIADKDARKFDLSNEFYASQLRKGLAINILKGGIWGK